MERTPWIINQHVYVLSYDTIRSADYHTVVEDGEEESRKGERGQRPFKLQGESEDRFGDQEGATLRRMEIQRRYGESQDQKRKRERERESKTEKEK